MVARGHSITQDCPREIVLLHNLFAKSYKDIQQIPVQGAKIKMSEYVCVAKVI